MLDVRTFGAVFIAGLLGLLLALPSDAASGKTLLMATTTSTDNTGLLDYLMPSFTAATDIKINWTSTGTGKALIDGSSLDCLTKLLLNHRNVTIQIVVHVKLLSLLIWVKNAKFDYLLFLLSYYDCQFKIAR